jgi:hypothetical protein
MLTATQVVGVGSHIKQDWTIDNGEDEVSSVGLPTSAERTAKLALTRTPSGWAEAR